MTTIQNTVLNPSNTPVAGAVVRITLVVSTTGNVPGYLPAADIIGTTTVHTDATGHWSTELTPNSEITPAGTYYLVNESGYVSTIVVPASGGPYDLSDVVVNPPNPSPLGIRFTVDDTLVATRPGLNLIAGHGIDLTATDDPGNSTVSIVVTSTGGGGGGGGSVDSVNSITPDAFGNVQLAAADVGAVALTGAQSIGGVKTFADPPVVPAGTFPQSAVAGLAADLAARALNNTVIHTTGAETVNGVKTFTSAPVVPAGAFPQSAVANLPADLAARALDTAVVHTTGAENINGVKTFLAAPVVPAGAFPQSAVTNLGVDLAARALDTAVVHTTGAETIEGVKTFTAAPVVPAGAFPQSAVAGLDDDLASKVPTSQLGAANGVATLDAGGKLTAAQLPAIAVVSYLGAVESQTAMLALTGEEGDWCTRSDLGTNWVITGADPTHLNGWTQLSYPTAPVSSVNGQTGAVSLTAANVGALSIANNLSDVTPVTARSNLGLGGAATLNVGAGAGTVAAGDDSRIVGAAQKASNLGDLADAGTARSNLGLGSAATLGVGTAAGTVAAGNDSRIVGAAQKASNLGDLTDAGTARSNLGLGGAATLSVGTAAGTVAAGDDSRITGAQQRSTLTTKGDLYAATGAAAVTRLPAGTDGQVLTADSSQTAGLKWATPAGGGGGSGVADLAITPVSGRWSAGLPFGRGGGSNLTMPAGYAVGAVLEVTADCTIDRIATEVATTSSSGGRLRAVLYAATSYADTRPAALIADYGQIPSDDGTGQHTWTVSQALTAGVRYILVIIAQVTSAVLRTTETYDPRVTLAAFPSGTVAAGAYGKTGITGTPPSTFGTPADEVPIRVAVRFA